MSPKPDFTDFTAERLGATGETLKEVSFKLANELNEKLFAPMGIKASIEKSVRYIHDPKPDLSSTDLWITGLYSAHTKSTQVAVHPDGKFAVMTYFAGNPKGNLYDEADMQGLAEFLSAAVKRQPSLISLPQDQSKMPHWAGDLVQRQNALEPMVS